MKALHFGAGNIGRGFIGKSLSLSGFNLVFSDINQDIVDAINYYKEYNVQLVDSNIKNNQDNIVNIKNVSAINSYDPKIVKIISEVSLITTAVGPSALNKISLIIVQGILLKIKEKSTQPLNIIACENKIKASSYLKKCILNILPEKHYNYLNQYIGFIDCTIDTIIPISNLKNKDDLFLLAEDFKEWIVDVTQFKGKIPKIIDMKLSNNLISFIDRKLFTLNTGHAIAAYLGLIKKYNTIYEAILDKNIQSVVRDSMKESGAVLIKHYNFNQDDHFLYIEKIFCRFSNPFLPDSLKRIARNPLQKLHVEERLIKPLLGAIKYKLPYSNLIKGIAAAFHYQDKNDLESMKIASLIKNKGIEKTLLSICNLNKNSAVVYSIIKEYISMI